MLFFSFNQWQTAMIENWACKIQPMDMAPSCTTLTLSFLLVVLYPTTGIWLMSVKSFTWAKKNNNKKKVTQLSVAIGRMTTTVSQQLAHGDKDISWEEATALQHGKWSLPWRSELQKGQLLTCYFNAIRNWMSFILSAHERLTFKGTSVFTLNVFLRVLNATKHRHRNVGV